MQLGRLVGVLAVVVGVTLAVAAPARAQDYPPAEPVLVVSATTVVVGETITLSGSGFGPGEEILINVSTTPFAASSLEQGEPGETTMVLVSQNLAMAAQQTVVADADGAFTTTVTLTEVGLATISATGLSSGLSASVVVTVLADAPLPLTGESIGWMLWTGGAAVLLGVLLVGGMVLWRRRAVAIAA